MNLMMETVLQEEVAAAVIAELARNAMDQIYDGISGQINSTRAKFFESFKRYTEHTLRRTSYVRTLYSKNKPVDLDSIYIDTAFIFSTGYGKTEKLREHDLVEKFAAGERFVVKGNGGSGKTIFLKKLWRDRFLSSQGKIPLLIELRRFNEINTVDLLAFCRLELQAGSTLTEKTFLDMCEAGRFEFIFDGFDEVNREKRSSVEKQITDLSSRFVRCPILVSGRDDERFGSWLSFSVLSVAPMRRADAKNLINKIEFDRVSKKKFLATMSEDFFEKHKSFLSSPLLAIMMLMTFHEEATVPDKLTAFYQSAFHTLLTWHDATKESFQREKTLKVDEFRKVFSTFCMISYYDQLHEFDESQLREYLRKSLSYHSLEVDVEDVITDLCEAVNLIQKEGLGYIFIHRSFQEYFAAECVMRVISAETGPILEAFSKRRRDSVFQMCYELQPDRVYDEFLDPLIQEYCETNFFKTPKSSSPRSYFERFIQEIELGFIMEKKEIRFNHGVLNSFRSSATETDIIAVLELLENRSGIGAIDMAGFESVSNSLEKILKEKESMIRENVKISFKIEVDGENVVSTVWSEGETVASENLLNGLRERVEMMHDAILRDAAKKMSLALIEKNKGIKRLREDRAQKGRSMNSILGIV